MSKSPLWIEGLAFWSREWPSWTAARAAFRDEAGGPEAAVNARARPSPDMLAPNERRRAPDAVALALEVASQAVAASGLDPRSLASVFTSAHGDLPIVEALCTTLATHPALLSPTRFHHSVHNAASGYWAIGVKAMAPSTSLAAFDASFAAGLVEAAAQCLADARPVLLVGFDTEAEGALASANSSRGLLGVALVISSTRSPRSLAGMSLSFQPGATAAAQSRSAAARALCANAMADSLPFFEALALEASAAVVLRLHETLSIEVKLHATQR